MLGALELKSKEIQHAPHTLGFRLQVSGRFILEIEVSTRERIRDPVPFTVALEFLAIVGSPGGKQRFTLPP
jgi:hypothetical protein